MNEKYLWELWAKCKHPHPKYGGGEMVWPIEFAELIVRECAEFANEHNEEIEGVTLGVGQALKKHFGVEE